MPTITFNTKELERYAGKKLSAKLLQEKIPFLGTPLEEMDSQKITIEVNPNRPDLLSLPGFARAFSSFLGVNKGLKKYSAKKSTYKVIIDEKVGKVRPFTVCAVVKGLTISDEKLKEIIDLQEKLHITFGRKRKKMALGIYPLDKISFPITYTAEKPEKIFFTPLDFSKKMDGNQILALHPTGKKYADLLKDEKLFPLFVDSKKDVLSMPPVINSNKVGKITTKTNSVFVECSGFDMGYLGKALNMVVTSLADMGGTIFEVELDYKNKKIKSPQLEAEEKTIDLKYINELLGLNLSLIKAKALLEKMGFGIKGKNGLIPCYRTDILHQADFAEEIAIAYGYENFEAIIPKVACTAQEDPQEVFENNLRNILIGAGFIEVKNFFLSSQEKQNKKVLQEEELVEIENTFSEEFSVLRRHILPEILETLSRNKHREYPQNIFEIGRIVQGGEKIHEKQRMGCAVCHKNADFTRIKQVAEAIMRELGIKHEYSVLSSADFSSFIDGRVAKIIINKKPVAHIGEIRPQVLENFELEMPVAYLEMNLEKLFKEVKNSNS